MSFSSIVGRPNRPGATDREMVQEEQPASPSAFPDLPAIADGDPDAEEHKAIQGYAERLATLLQEAAPHIDFEKEYSPLKQMREKGPQQAPRQGALSQFAIALGAGNEGLNRAEGVRQGEQSRHDQSFQDAMELQREAIRGHIAQQMEQGKFKQAIAQSTELQRLESTLERIRAKRKHDYEMDLEDKRIQGRKDLQEVKDTHARERLNKRLEHLADSYHLDERNRAEFFRQMLGVYSARLKQQDVTGDPVITGDDFNKTMEEAIDWAEEHSGMDLTQPLPRPGTTPPPAPAPTGRPSGQAWRDAAKPKPQ